MTEAKEDSVVLLSEPGAMPPTRASVRLLILVGLTLASLIASQYQSLVHGQSPRRAYEFYVAKDDYSEFPLWVPRDDQDSLKPSIQTTALNRRDNNIGTQDLVEKAKLASDGKTVTLIYASYSYRQPLFNWLLANQKARSSATDGVLLVCLDEGLQIFVRSLGWDCYLEVVVKSTTPIGDDTNDPSIAEGSLNKDTVKSLWVTRVEHVVKILRSGLNVVLTDTDAIWLKDPVKQLLTSESGDIIASRANFPYNSPWGATMCMGFIIFKASPTMVKFAELALEETKLTLDDQIGFNNALMKLPFEPQGTRRLAFGRRLLPNGNSIGLATFLVDEHPLKVTLVEHDRIPRYCADVHPESWSATVLVAHCHVNEGKPAATNKHKGNQDTHTAILDKYNVYYLRPDWEDVLTKAFALSRSSQVHTDFEDLVKSLART